MEDLAQILGEELELPRIEPKGKESVSSKKNRFTGIRPTGPAALRHFKRSYKRALRRQISSGTYDEVGETQFFKRGNVSATGGQVTIR